MEILDDTVWQMSVGERAAIEGVLFQLRPDLAIEIGTAEGASLKRIAEHAREVHSFDLVSPSLELPPNVTLHSGDSHELLPQVLEQLAEEGRNVAFALVDGDHSAEGVRRDIEDLLNSAAVQQTIILVHDVNNEQVRRGVDAVRYRAWPKVAYVELDFVPGYMFYEPRLKHELWGGLGLIVVDAAKSAYATSEVLQQRYYAAAPLFAEIRDIVMAREEERAAQRSGELSDLRERVSIADEWLAHAEHAAAQERRARQALEDSVSWRLTRPLRVAKARARKSLS